MSVEASASPVIDASQEIGSASSAAAPDTANPPVDAQEPKQLTGDELMSTLRTQIEFYFSQQNLASDTFLLSKMNADKYVPVDVIAGFKKVKALTTDRDLVLQAMGKCQNCELDETNTMVRPAKSTSRDTLILRDIPKDTPTDEVKDIFSFAGAGEIVDIRPDIEDTWFVKFKSEEDCQKTALSLFGKTFKGKPVRARVKAAHTVRGFYQQPSRPNPNAGAFRPQQQQQWQGNGYYYGAGAGAGVSGAAGAAYGAYGMGGYGQWTDASQYGAQGKGRGRGQSAFGAMQANSPQVLPGAPGDGKKKKKKNKARNAAAPAGKPGQGRAGGRTGRPPLGPENFPALPTAKRASGYNRSFTKFSRESMADIAAKLSEQGFERPAGMPGPADCLAIREKPRLGTQLMKPFPIMYPASPSPMLQPQPKEVLEHGMPALDLGPKESPTSQSAMQRPTSAWVPMGAKALVGGGIHAALQNRTRSVVQAGSGAAPAAPSEKPAPAAAAPAVAKKTEAKSEAPAAAVSPSTSSPPVKPATPAAPASQAVAPAAKTSSGTSNDTNVKKLPSYADLLRKK